MMNSRLILLIVALGAACTCGAQALPKPEQVFGDAKICSTYKDSKPGTMALTKAPPGPRTS